MIWHEVVCLNIGTIGQKACLGTEIFAGSTHVFSAAVACVTFYTYREYEIVNRFWPIAEPLLHNAHMKETLNGALNIHKHKQVLPGEQVCFRQTI
jgi:hypothetical protein